MARAASPGPESELMKDNKDDITKTPSDSAEEIAQTEMPPATAEEIAQKVIIKVLADEFNRLMGQYARILALRKEFAERGIPDADHYGEAHGGEGGRCPVCYKTGERILDSAVCREHSVRWAWQGKQNHLADDPADPDYKQGVEKLESFREVEPFYEPLPLWDALDSASRNAPDCLAERIEEELVEAVMENPPSNGMVIAEQEREKWYAIRREEALKINPQTAEVMWSYQYTLDPYGTERELPEEFRQVGREYFARAPGSDIWVWFYDLPRATEDALWEKHKAKLAFPAGVEEFFTRCNSRLR